jgi:hypothetical protein
MNEEQIKVGDIVTSIWSSNAALWEVMAIGEEPQKRGYQNIGFELSVRSVKTGRTDTRFTRNMKIAPERGPRIVPRAALEARIAELEAENAKLRRGR